MELTPMMKQYLQIHEEVPDAILFFRLGDFYEMFFDDAITASKVLSLVLTGRACGLEEKAPMCGVPYHAASGYIAKLVKAGYKVAVCEQTEDAAEAKGLVRREIVQIISPGTMTDSAYLDEKENNFLLCAYESALYTCLSYIDISTAECKTILFSALSNQSDLLSEIEKIAPAEVVCNEVFYDKYHRHRLFTSRLNIKLSLLDDEYFDYDTAKAILKNQLGPVGDTFFSEDKTENAALIRANGAMLLYLKNMQKSALQYISAIERYSKTDAMHLDASTRYHLELIKSTRGSKKGSLLWVLDQCKTAMGARKLKSWIESPLNDRKAILERQGAVAALRDDLAALGEVRKMLQGIHDLQRVATIICSAACSPKNILMLKSSILRIGEIKECAVLSQSAYLQKIQNQIDDLADLYTLIDQAIDDEAPLAVKDGGVIKTGYHEQIDYLRKMAGSRQEVLSEMESEERESTGIKNLKIKYNKIFGYYIDVTNSYKDLVPAHYVRKQTLVNSERYYTEELKQLEIDILSAEESLLAKEKEIYEQVRTSITSQVERILSTAQAVAALDVLASFAQAAYDNRYNAPAIIEDGSITLVDSRHPVVELVETRNEFIPNSCRLDTDKRRMQIITGPNMAGKSTFIRQVALIVLMAQIGSFVPAAKAEISVVDRIFTRIGASDDISTGQSTFMVEMNEVSGILQNATKDSLIILDEMGRGTSTYDGLSIAWAVCEYIADKDLLGAKTLFATHYHELTDLAQTTDGVINLCIRALEQEEGVIFLRKIEEGIVDKSYGIEVAKLAALPDDVIERAYEILADLEEEHNKTQRGATTPPRPRAKTAQNENKSRLTPNQSAVLGALRTASIDSLSPLEALVFLDKLKKMLMEKEESK
jgi:DNA mismatch repair protein MutS